MNQREKPRIDLSALNKILLIRLRRIGDVVMTTPAVALLKTELPHSSISYLIEEPYRELVEGNSNLDGVITVPRKQKNRDFLRLIRKIRKERFDCLIDFHGGPRASWICFLSAARLKIGYSIQNKGFLYDIRIPRSPREGHVHSVENHVNLIRTLGFEASPIPPPFLPDAKTTERERVSNLIARKHGDETKVVVLHVGAGNRFRDWGIENLVRLTELLTQGSKVRVLLVGGGEDIERAEEIAETGRPLVLSLAGRIGLRELRELIAQADLFVGTDSGPMHVASSTETPIVALFGPTLPDHFRPWREKACLIEKNFECRSSCRQRKCLYEDFRCLRTITPDEVYARCAEFL